MQSGFNSSADVSSRTFQHHAILLLYQPNGPYQGRILIQHLLLPSLSAHATSVHSGSPPAVDILKEWTTTGIPPGDLTNENATLSYLSTHAQTLNDSNCRFVSCMRLKDNKDRTWSMRHMQCHITVTNSVSFTLSAIQSHTGLTGIVNSAVTHIKLIKYFLQIFLTNLPLDPTLHGRSRQGSLCLPRRPSSHSSWSGGRSNISLLQVCEAA